MRLEAPIAALFVSASAALGRVGYEYIPETDRGLLNAMSVSPVITSISTTTCLSSSAISRARYRPRGEANESQTPYSGGAS
jgi:hypothetical protein